MRHPSPDDLAVHALGALDPREKRKVARHSARCERSRAELIRLAPAVGALGESVEQHEPPPELRRRLLAEVRSDALEAAEGGGDAKGSGAARVRRPRSRSGIGGFLLRPAAGLAALALVAAGAAGYLIAGGEDEAGTSLAVSSTLPGAEATLRVEDDSATLEAEGMPALAKGAVYQVWVADESGVSPSASFVPHEDGSATAAVPEVLEGADEVMVTRESMPGHSAPTSAPVLRARVES